MAGCLPNPQARETLVIVGGTYLPARDAEPIPGAILLMEGPRISAAGPQSHIPFPKGVETLDARGRWIVPGLGGSGKIELFPEGQEATGDRVGAPADLLIFKNNPVTNGTAAASLVVVVRAGRVTDAAPANKP